MTTSANWNSPAQPLLEIDNLQVKPLYWVDNNQNVTESGAYCVTDGSKYYGTVGGRYHPLSYKDAFEFVQKCVNSRLNIEGYAANKQLSKGIITCNFNSTGSINGDNISLYINIVNSLDGSTPVGILVTPMRVCCMNQYRLLKRSAFIKLNYRHTAHGLTLMKSHSSLITEIKDMFNEQLGFSNDLYARPIDDSSGQKLIQDMWSNEVINERTKDAAINIWLSPKRQEDQPRNEWVLFNAITEPINRYLGVKNRWSTVRELDRVGKFFAERI